MHVEVELKFPVADFAAVVARLDQMSARWHAPVEQVDLYYAHPVRDFAATDEALRIRRVGARAWITYKGPKLDSQTKTRRELELPLVANSPEGDVSAADRWHELLAALGFRPAAEVRKLRRACQLEIAGRQIEVACDDVEGLGKFVELETAADSGDLDAARAVLLGVARNFCLTSGERRSYLELLELRHHLS